MFIIIFINNIFSLDENKNRFEYNKIKIFKNIHNITKAIMKITYNINNNI